VSAVQKLSGQPLLIALVNAPPISTVELGGRTPAV
jgi:hypothetical protein